MRPTPNSGRPVSEYRCDVADCTTADGSKPAERNERWRVSVSYGHLFRSDGQRKAMDAISSEFAGTGSPVAPAAPSPKPPRKRPKALEPV
jgi:hypothetical protein